MYRKKIPEIPDKVPDVPGTGRALRADVPCFPEYLTRKLYRKKIPENGPEVPGVPGPAPAPPMLSPVKQLPEINTTKFIACLNDLLKPENSASCKIQNYPAYP